MQQQNLTLRLESSIDAWDATRRRIPGHLSKLLVALHGKQAIDTASLELAAVLMKIKKGHEVIMASAINILGGQADIMALHRKYQDQPTQVHSDSYSSVLTFSTSEGLSRLFASCQCEAIVIAFGGSPDDRAALGQANSRVLAMTGNQYELPYIDQVDYFGGFGFFAASHKSIEFIGTREFILGRCLLPLIA